MTTETWKIDVYPHTVRNGEVVLWYPTLRRVPDGAVVNLRQCETVEGARAVAKTWLAQRRKHFG